MGHIMPLGSLPALDNLLSFEFTAESGIPFGETLSFLAKHGNRISDGM